MSDMQSLADLLQDELRDIYDAEKQLTKALPKLAKKAWSEELRDAIQQHLQETEGHVEKVEQAFESLGLSAKTKKCEGMKHLIAEGSEMIDDTDEGPSRDAIMIAGAQKVEHYEIAAYGTLRTWANLLGKSDAAAIFEEILEEEKAADAKLTEVAETAINAEAAGEESESEDDMPARPAQRRGSSRATNRQAAADRGRGSNRGRR